jgi:hypothetical protein
MLAVLYLKRSRTGFAKVESGFIAAAYAPQRFGPRKKMFDPKVAAGMVPANSSSQSGLSRSRKQYLARFPKGGPWLPRGRQEGGLR